MCEEAPWYFWRRVIRMPENPSFKDAHGFSPGHITGFFAPFYRTDVLRTGSYGAGVCIAKGAWAEVEIEEADQRQICVKIEGVDAEPKVSIYALQNLIPENMRVNARIKLDMPVSQGFGMSAAGTLSACIAVCKILKKRYSDALRCAHAAEVHFRTGLGDVAGIYAGGYEMRIKPGIPPYGIIDRILNLPDETELVLCVIGKELETKNVLGNPDAVESCIKAGKKCLRKLRAEPTVRNFFKLSFEFAIETGLASREIKEAIIELHKIPVPASMIMLGNSVFALVRNRNEKKRVKDVLSSYGSVTATHVWAGF